MKTKLFLSVFLSTGLVFTLGCGLQVGSLDVGKIASSSANILSGGKMTVKEEIAIGQQMAAVIVGSSKLHKDVQLQKYVNRVGQWVASHSTPLLDKQQQLSWQFIVIDTPDFNAFAMPGGYVVISSGVIDRLSNEAELAAVLAHEIVHIEQKHQVRAIEKSKQFSSLGELAFLASDYSQAQKGGYSGTAAKNRKIAEGMFNITFNLYTQGIGRDDELDADEKAVVLLARAGYDPYAYLAMLQIIESMDDSRKALMLATHPKASDRLNTAYESLTYVESYASQTKSVEKRFLKQVQ